MDWLLLTGLIAAYIWYFSGAGFERGGRTVSGLIARYRRCWIRRAALVFGATSLGTLLVAERIDALWTFPTAFARIATVARYLAGFGHDIALLKAAVLVGFGGGRIA